MKIYLSYIYLFLLFGKREKYIVITFISLLSITVKFFTNLTFYNSPLSFSYNYIYFFLFLLYITSWKQFPPLSFPPRSSTLLLHFSSEKGRPPVDVNQTWHMYLIVAVDLKSTPPIKAGRVNPAGGKWCKSSWKSQTELLLPLLEIPQEDQTTQP